MVDFGSMMSGTSRTRSKTDTAIDDLEKKKKSMLCAELKFLLSVLVRPWNKCLSFSRSARAVGKNSAVKNEPLTLLDCVSMYTDNEFINKT